MSDFLLPILIGVLGRVMAAGIFEKEERGVRGLIGATTGVVVGLCVELSIHPIWL